MLLARNLSKFVRLCVKSIERFGQRSSNYHVQCLIFLHRIITISKVSNYTVTILKFVVTVRS